MKSLQKEFIPYELALRMKALGFDESCFAIWSGINELNFSVTDTTRLYSSEFRINGSQSCKSYVNDFNSRRVAAPLYQQAFRWFREKYKLFGEINLTTKQEDVEVFEFFVLDINEPLFESNDYTNYEEAEQACLEKLIEIVEQRA
jgi:hypothetical protein